MDLWAALLDLTNIAQSQEWVLVGFLFFQKSSRTFRSCATSFEFAYVWEVGKRIDPYNKKGSHTLFWFVFSRVFLIFS